MEASEVELGYRRGTALSGSHDASASNGKNRSSRNRDFASRIYRGRFYFSFLVQRQFLLFIFLPPFSYPLLHHPLQLLASISSSTRTLHSHFTVLSNRSSELHRLFLLFVSTPRSLYPPPSFHQPLRLFILISSSIPTVRFRHLSTLHPRFAVLPSYSP